MAASRARATYQPRFFTFSHRHVARAKLHDESEWRNPLHKWPEWAAEEVARQMKRYVIPQIISVKTLVNFIKEKNAKLKESQSINATSSQRISTKQKETTTISQCFKEKHHEAQIDSKSSLPNFLQKGGEDSEEAMLKWRKLARMRIKKRIKEKTIARRNMAKAAIQAKSLAPLLATKQTSDPVPKLPSASMEAQASSPSPKVASTPPLEPFPPLEPLSPMVLPFTLSSNLDVNIKEEIQKLTSVSIKEEIQKIFDMKPEMISTRKELLDKAREPTKQVKAREPTKQAASKMKSTSTDQSCGKVTVCIRSIASRHPNPVKKRSSSRVRVNPKQARYKTHATPPSCPATHRPQPPHLPPRPAQPCLPKSAQKGVLQEVEVEETQEGPVAHSIPLIPLPWQALELPPSGKQRSNGGDKARAVTSKGERFAEVKASKKPMKRKSSIKKRLRKAGKNLLNAAKRSSPRLFPASTSAMYSR